MPNIVEVTDLTRPELAVFTRLTEAQLRNRLEPEKGIFIAESPRSSPVPWTPAACPCPCSWSAVTLQGTQRASSSGAEMCRCLQRNGRCWLSSPASP